MKEDLVSIITPAYNCEKYISQTIESVLAQTYQNWEMIITNDCSTDMTERIVREYIEKDNRIKLINLEKNSGVAAARNTSMNMSTGRYIAFLDSDDYWLPEKLECQVNFMRHKKCGFSFTGYRNVCNGVIESKAITPPQTVTYKSALKGNPIGCLTVLLDKKIVGDVYMDNIRHEDYVLWLKILKNNTLGFGLQKDLARYRKSNEALTSDKKKSAIWTWKIYRHIECLSLIKSAWYFSNYLLQGIYKHYYRYLRL